LLLQEQFDLLLCDFLTPTLCLPESLTVPVVLFEHNVESALWARRASTVSGTRRVLYDWEARATLAWEKRWVRQAKLTLAVSESDRQGLLDLVPGANVAVVPTGVDVQAFAPTDAFKRRDDLVVFVGSMDWQPNEDGVVWFANEVWPLVTRHIPDAVLRVVGRRPSDRVLALRTRGIEVTGDVVSVQPHLGEAALTVVPLRAGGGTRLKIFEAMAGGAPVVSTAIGAEGLDVEDGQDIVLANSEQQLAGAIVGLLNDPAHRTRLAHSGLRTARRHDWSTIARELAGILASVK